MLSMTYTSPKRTHHPLNLPPSSLTSPPHHPLTLLNTQPPPLLTLLSLTHPSLTPLHPPITHPGMYTAGVGKSKGDFGQ